MSPATATDVFNAKELLQRCMGNADIAERILSKFLDRFAADIAEMEQGVAEQDGECVTRIAHRIKGSSANVAAHSLCEVAAEIERMGRAEELSGVPTQLSQLRTEWTRFVAAVSDLDLRHGNSR